MRPVPTSKCPQAKENGNRFGGYDLIRDVLPGDIVFHYSTSTQAYVAASVAGGPMEDRAIVWQSHSSMRLGKRSTGEPRPGSWRPLYGSQRASEPLTLEELHRKSGSTQAFKYFARDLRKVIKADGLPTLDTVAKLFLDVRDAILMRGRVLSRNNNSSKSTYGSEHKKRQHH